MRYATKREVDDVIVNMQVTKSDELIQINRTLQIYDSITSNGIIQTGRGKDNIPRITTTTFQTDTN